MGRAACSGQCQDSCEVALTVGEQPATEQTAHMRPAADKVKVSIVLSADIDFKLSVASAALRMDRSALVNQILAESPTMRRFVVQDRAKPAGEAAEEVSAGGGGQG